MKEKIKNFLGKNILLTNSFNLMLSTATSAFFGFIFWIINAHFFNPSEIGLATTLLSTSFILSLLGLAGFDSIFIRFLAKSKEHNEQINSGLIISGVTSAFIAGLFCLLIPLLSPKLHFLINNLVYTVIFIIATVFTTWNTLTNAILISYRRTSFVLGITLIFSILKVISPVIVHTNGPMTIFSIVAVAQIVNVLLSVAVLTKYFNYQFSLKFNFNLIQKTLRYGTTVYLSTLLGLLPDSALPLIIVNKLGSTDAAYFYISFAIANLLYNIAYTTNQALLAETAHDDKNLFKNALKGLKIMSGLIIPGTILVFLFSPIALNLFGKSYQIGAINLLRIMTLSSIPIMFYAFMSFIFKQKKNLRAILTMSFTNTFSIIFLSLIFIKSYGLVGVGWAFSIGTLIAIFVGATVFIFSKKPSYKKSSTPQKILISHFYSKENKGDAALLSVLISDVRREFKFKKINIIASDKLTKNEKFESLPMHTSFMFYAMDRFTNKYLTIFYSIFIMVITLLWTIVFKFTELSLPINKKFRELCLLYSEADLIIPVGGGYFRGQNKGIGSLLYVSLIIHPFILSYILKKPTVLYTQSIGPFSNAFEERLVAYVLNTFTQASILRENDSFDLLKRIGVNKNVYRSVDSGFAFKQHSSTYNLRKELKIKKQLVIGITAKKYLRGKAQLSFEKSLADTTKFIIENYNAAVVFIPQVTAEILKDDDRVIHKRIKEHIPNIPNVYLIDKKFSHYEIKAIYDSLDIIIGTRFHSVIFSLTAKVPAIAVEYEYKTGGIMRDLKLYRWVIKIEEVNSKNLSRMTSKLIEERTDYKKYLETVMPAYIAKTEEPIKFVSDHYKKFVKQQKSYETKSNFLVKMKSLFKLKTITKGKQIQPAL